MCDLDSSSAFPPANFTDWTGTRIGALVFNGVVLILLVVTFTVPTCAPPPRNRPRGWFVPAHRACPWSVVQPVLVGLLAGLWLHFLPCIFWTCDWSNCDGEGFRGAVWFVTWAVVAVVMFALNCVSTKNAEEEPLGAKDDDHGLSPPAECRDGGEDGCEGGTSKREQGSSSAEEPRRSTERESIPAPISPSCSELRVL